MLPIKNAKLYVFFLANVIPSLEKIDAAPLTPPVGGVRHSLISYGEKQNISL